MNVARLRTYAGLAAAIVPCAMLVHLISEAAAVGQGGLGLAFVIRHAYFGVLFAAAGLWFGTTAGVGQPLMDRRRRCALVRADLRADYGRQGLVTLLGANLGFYAVTQVLEGVPVAAGPVAMSLSIALAGSVAAALLVFFFGRAIAAATIDAVIGSTARRNIRRIFSFAAHAVAAPRHATATYSLLRPNRPPPIIVRF